MTSNLNGTPFSDVRTVARKIVQHTVLHNGGTFDPRSGESIIFADAEYIIGGAQDETIVPIGDDSGVDYDAVIDAVAAHIQRIPRRADGSYFYFLGTWVEGTNLYIDSSEALRNRREALALGRKRGEIAIYDTLAGESVFC